MASQLLIGIHAGLGELGAIAFLWVFIELLSLSESGVRRLKRAILWGMIFILASWLIGGYYYVATYGPAVKPIIKEGLQPWAHGVIMETKEHIFLFLPFLSFLAWGFMKAREQNLLTDQGTRRALLALCALIVLLGFSMAAMGYAISSSARNALEIKLL